MSELEINRTRMARELGIDIAHVSRIFSGKGTPSLKLAWRIAEYLGITVDELYQHLAGLKEKLQEPV